MNSNSTDREDWKKDPNSLSCCICCKCCGGVVKILLDIIFNHFSLTEYSFTPTVVSFIKVLKILLRFDFKALTVGLRRRLLALQCASAALSAHPDGIPSRTSFPAALPPSQIFLTQICLSQTEKEAETLTP